MKKNIFIYALLLTIVVLCGDALYLMNKSEEMQKIDVESDKVQEISSSLYNFYMVSKTDIYDYRTYTAEFSSSDAAIRSLFTGNPEAEISVKVGDVVSEGDILYKIGEKEELSDSRYKCLKIVRNKEDVQITLLDLTKLRIKCTVPFSFVLDDISGYEYYLYQTDYDNIILTQIDADESTGYASLYFDFISETDIRYSDAVYIKVCVEKRNGVIAVPTEYILCPEDMNLCKVNKHINGEIVVTDVQIGLIADGYAEIISGLAEGDELVSVDKESSLSTFLSVRD